MNEASIVARLTAFRSGVLLSHRHGLLDSLDSVELIELSAFIDQAFNVTVRLEDVTAENFATLETVVAMIQAKLRQREHKL